MQIPTIFYCMTDNQEDVIDGKGAERIAKEIIKL